MSRSSIVASSKQAERDVAELLGGRRLHAGEWQGPGDVDVVSPKCVAQVKHRSGVPAYILEGEVQILEAMADQPQMRRLYPNLEPDPYPVVVLYTKPGSGRPARKFIVVDEATWLRAINS